jgi:hypothetical protein
MQTIFQKVEAMAWSEPVLVGGSVYWRAAQRKPFPTKYHFEP